MNKYEQRKMEREREAARKHKEISEEHHYLHMTIADRYGEAYKELHGTAPDIRYDKGWYLVKYSKLSLPTRYRGLDIVRMTNRLHAELHIKHMDNTIEHPEYLREDQ